MVARARVSPSAGPWPWTWGCTQPKAPSPFPLWVTRGGLWRAVLSTSNEEDKESGSSKWGQQEAGGVKEEQ